MKPHLEATILPELLYMTV